MDEIFKLLNHDNTVTISRPLAHALGVNEAIIYSALIAKQIYYERRGMLDEDGYFYSTIADLNESTGLTRCKQDNAIKNLLETNLINYHTKGIPAKRYFRVNDNVESLKAFLEKGEMILSSLNPLAKNNSKQVCKKVATLSAENPQTCLGEIDKHTYNPNNKSKDKNQSYQSIPDWNDMIDNSTRACSTDERARYLQLIQDNIEYEYQTEKEKVDELIAIMLDVVCSTSSTVRVNGEDMPHEVVKSRFLKLDSSHIDYVMTSLKKNTSEVKNIRAYLITALYNAPTTMDNYYTAWVNHDMHG